MDQKDFEKSRSAQLNALKLQAERMDAMVVIENQRRLCTDDCGRLNKEKFMLFVGLFLVLCSDKDGFCESLKGVNNYLSKILGRGHTFASCVQFIKGKRGQRVYRKCIYEWECRRQASLGTEGLAAN